MVIASGKRKYPYLLKNFCQPAGRPFEPLRPAPLSRMASASGERKSPYPSRISASRLAGLLSHFVQRPSPGSRALLAHTFSQTPSRKFASRLADLLSHFVPAPPPGWRVPPANASHRPVKGQRFHQGEGGINAQPIRRADHPRGGSGQEGRPAPPPLWHLLPPSYTLEAQQQAPSGKRQVAPPRSSWLYWRHARHSR